MSEHAREGSQRTPTSIPAKGWLRGRKQAADHCGVSKRTINRWMAHGVLKYRKLSPKLLLFRPEEIDAAIEELAQQYENNPVIPSAARLRHIRRYARECRAKRRPV